MRSFLIFLLAASAAFGQISAGGALTGTYPKPRLAPTQTDSISWSGSQTFIGSLDASAALFSKPIRYGSTLPISCQPWEWFILTTGTSGQVYLCDGSGHWISQAGSGSGGSTSPYTLLSTTTYQDPNWLATLAWSKITGAPAIPTLLSQLTNDTGYLTSSSSLAWARIADAPTIPTVPTAVSQFTNDAGYLTSSSTVAWARLSGVPTIPTLVSQLTNDSAYLTAASSLSWARLTGVPSFATVATSGSYADLSNKPSLATVATSGSYTDLSGRPSLATVATSGSYSDLSNKPTITAQVQSDWTAGSGIGQILNKPSLATVATSGSYTDLSNKPTIPAAQVQSDWTAGSGMGQILNKPTIPSASSTSPLIDGTAASGSSATYARSDHIHPTDTTRQAAITTGTTAQYFRGDLSLATFPTIPTVSGSGLLKGSSGNAVAATSADVIAAIGYTPLSSAYNQSVSVSDVVQPQRSRLNFIAGSSVTLTPSDNSVGGSTDITISASISGGGGGLPDPGANGLIKRISLNTTAAALLSDITALTGTGSGAVTNLGLGSQFQAPITTGTTAQYFRGDLSLASFPSVPTVTGSSLLKGSAGNAVAAAISDITDITGVGSTAVTSLGLGSQFQAPISGAPGTWPSTFVPATHASAHLSNGGDPIAAASITVRGTVTTTTSNSQAVSTDDSRMTNTRTPTAHASSHQNGGGDEIATATAAANAIPKAGAGSKLDIGWLPTGSSSTTVALGNDARLSDARTPVAPTASTLGGIKSFDCTGTGHLLKVDLTGMPTCTADTGGGMADPGSNGLLKRTALNTTAAASLSDLTTLTGTGATAATNLGLATIAGSGSYNDLSNKPTIPAAQVQPDWTAGSGMGQILNKPSLATVATSGSYNDLSSKPTIPSAQVQTDWTAGSGMGVLLNKPTLYNQTVGVGGTSQTQRGRINLIAGTNVTISPADNAGSGSVDLTIADAGLADPGSNGLVKRTSLSTTGVATDGLDYISSTYAASGSLAMVSVSSNLTAGGNVNATGSVSGSAGQFGLGARLAACITILRPVWTRRFAPRPPDYPSPVPWPWSTALTA